MRLPLFKRRSSWYVLNAKHDAPVQVVNEMIDSDGQIARQYCGIQGENRRRCIWRQHGVHATELSLQKVVKSWKAHAVLNVLTNGRFSWSVYRGIHAKQLSKF
jgi:hypothetical protein